MNWLITYDRRCQYKDPKACINSPLHGCIHPLVAGHHLSAILTCCCTTSFQHCVMPVIPQGLFTAGLITPELDSLFLPFFPSANCMLHNIKEPYKSQVFSMTQQQSLKAPDKLALLNRWDSTTVSQKVYSISFRLYDCTTNGNLVYL